MSNVVRTAMGRMLDMTSLINKNEKVRAVSNLNVNARGDRIDAFGNVIESANDNVAKHYNSTVGNKSARVRPTQKNKKIVEPVLELTQAEKELQQQLEQEDQALKSIKKD